MIDRKYLPSKKFWTALSVTLFIILLSVVISIFSKNTVKYSNDSLVSATNTASSFTNTDSDNDGLPDWKEALYGTDPHNPDTDGDGTNDGDEVAQGRDPLKPNTAPKGQEPNDKIDPVIIEKNNQLIQNYENLSETDKLSRTIFSNIIASQPINGSMDQSSVNSIVENTLSAVPQKNYSGITKSTDLNLLQTNSANLIINLSEYAKSFANETQKLINILGADTNIIDSYISNGDKTAKAKMLSLTDKYQDVVNNLIKMPVPVAIGYYDITYHLKVINDLEIIIAIDRDIVNSEKSSLGIFPNLLDYNNTMNDLFSTLTIIDSILKIQR